VAKRFSFFLKKKKREEGFSNFLFFIFFFSPVFSFAGTTFFFFFPLPKTSSRPATTKHQINPTKQHRNSKKYQHNSKISTKQQNLRKFSFWPKNHQQNNRLFFPLPKISSRPITTKQQINPTKLTALKQQKKNQHNNKISGNFHSGPKYQQNSKKSPTKLPSRRKLDSKLQKSSFFFRPVLQSLHHRNIKG
jgi:hypothetical protein